MPILKAKLYMDQFISLHNMHAVTFISNIYVRIMSKTYLCHSILRSTQQGMFLYRSTSTCYVQIHRLEDDTRVNSSDHSTGRHK